MAVASLVQLGFLLDPPSQLSSNHRDEALVWADAAQAQGRPGGHVLAHWLAGEPVEPPDLHAWCDALLH